MILKKQYVVGLGIINLMSNIVPLVVASCLIKITKKFFFPKQQYYRK